jgi:hypothetical protein
VAVNAADTEQWVHLSREALGGDNKVWLDLLSGEEFRDRGEGLQMKLYPSWLRILEEQDPGPAV